MRFTLFILATIVAVGLAANQHLTAAPADPAQISAGLPELLAQALRGHTNRAQSTGKPEHLPFLSHAPVLTTVVELAPPPHAHVRSRRGF